MKKVTILGLGAMGSRMAGNFLKKGYALNIWNRSPERCKPLVELGARQFETPKEAVKGADIVIAMLSNDEASKSVWLNPETGALNGLKENAIAIECSTLSVEWCLDLAQKIGSANIQFVDAPVVGSRPQAEATQLIHLVGGDKTIIQSANDVLEVNSTAIYHVGGIGSGMAMKLAVNGLFGMQVAALGEMLGVLESFGVNKEAAIKLLNELPTTSPALKGVGMAIQADNFAPLFPIDLVEKDFSYLISLAESQQSDAPVTKSTLNVYQKAQLAGFGKENIAGLVQLYCD